MAELSSLLAETLAEHDWRWTRREPKDGSPIAIGCECGEWTADLNGEPGWAAHRAHVGAELAKVVAAWINADQTRESVRQGAPWVDWMHIGDVLGALAALARSAGGA